MLYPRSRLRSTCVLSSHTIHWFGILNGPLTRNIKLRVAHAPGIPGTFSSPPTLKGPTSLRSQHASLHVRHTRAVMHVGIADQQFDVSGNLGLKLLVFFLHGSNFQSICLYCYKNLAYCDVINSMQFIHFLLFSVLIRYASVGITDEPECESAKFTRTNN